MNAQPHDPQATPTDVCFPLPAGPKENSSDAAGKNDTERSYLRPDEPEPEELDAVVWLSIN